MSTRLSHFELPPQWSTMREAAAIKRRTGRTMIHMEKGDYVSTEFKPPQEAIEAVARSLADGFVRYSPGPGLWSLREALAQEMTQRGRPTRPEEIIVTPGAKFAIAACLLLFLDDGDEVIMPNPGYPPDEFWARYLRAPIRHLSFRDPRHVDVEHLESLITQRTRLLILNTPQRPNGQLIHNLDEIAAVLRRHPHVTIVSDEIFSHIVYEPQRHQSLAYDPTLRERTVVIDTFSKTFAMTGFRIGWLTAPAHLAQNFDILVQNSCTNVPTFIQEAALAALQVKDQYVPGLLQALRRKRDLAFQILSTSQKLSVENAQGSFYLYPNLPRGVDDRAVVRLLLEHGVAVVPGSAFGSAGAGSLRLTFTLEDQELAEGVSRLVEVVDNSISEYEHAAEQ